MDIKNLDIDDIEEELLYYDERIRMRLREIGRKQKETKGAISTGKILHYDLSMAHKALCDRRFEDMLDLLHNLKKQGLKFKSVTFHEDHKTFSQPRLEDIKRNPEQMIKRSKSWGGGFGNKIRQDEIGGLKF